MSLTPIQGMAPGALSSTVQAMAAGVSANKTADTAAKVDPVREAMQQLEILAKRYGNVSIGSEVVAGGGTEYSLRAGQTTAHARSVMSAIRQRASIEAAVVTNQLTGDAKEDIQG